MSADSETDSDSGTDAIEAYRHALAHASETADVVLGTGTDLVPTSGTESALQMKKRLGAAHQQIARVRRDALVAQAAAKDLIEAKKRELNAMMAEMDAQLAPLKQQMERMEDGITAFNLYLGRDEEITLLRDGEPAPADTIVHLRQTTLAMDEESAIAADTGGIDFQDIDLFGQWLVADEAHVDQLIPEQKAVVAVRPRNQGKQYTADPWDNAALNAENWKTFWLIRNGEQLWLTATDFKAGPRVIPTATEFTAMFTQRLFDGTVERLQPGSRQWLEAEERADLYTRHYMKVGLILQGLVDRTKVLHPLPSGGLSFLEQAHYDSGQIRVITDAELAIGTGRKPFNEWLREAGSRLEPGMRIVGAFTGYGRGFNRYSDNKNWVDANVVPEGAMPKDGIYVIRASSNKNFDFAFSFDRGDPIWDQEISRYRAPKTKGTGMFSAGDHFVLPIDTVTVEEMEEYLAARSERHAYLTMFPLLKAAIEFKRQELETERPFRDALVGQLLALDGDAGEFAAATAEADDLIAWYKTSNKWHRALTPEDAKPAKLILTEARRRRTGADKDAGVIQKIDEFWAESGDGREIMAIVRRSNDYVAVVPETRKFPEACVSQTVFVTTLIFTKSGTLTERRDWANLSRAQISRWSTLRSNESWDGWTIGANKSLHLSDPEVDQVLETIHAHPYEGTPFEIRWSESIESLAVGPRIEVIITGDPARNSHRRRLVYVTRQKGKLSTHIDHERPAPWGQSDGAPEWRVNYSGDGKIADRVIWNNPAVEAQETARWAAYIAKQRAARELHRATSALVVSIMDAWKAREWETLKARYVEDFGDDGLWDDYKKGVKEPKYPYRERYYESAGGSPHLYNIIEALVSRGTPPYGLTVGEAAEAAALADTPLPDELLELRFQGKPQD